ncbi:hypothetical protein [Candidatus Accumulibacter sp. ACC007]|uniref:hypothetical protein n=1 Tax=Candidatus Accumulibacter sp. ACC007 TaxID=2823333 RepID=UPI0025C577DB|nr:hypothetical protein [Candidatus Accumulibacter sp. ACC007]
MKTTSLILLLALAGCVAQPQYPDSPKLRQCKFEATKATAGKNFYGGTGVIGGAYSEQLAYRNILEACMAQ